MFQDRLSTLSIWYIKSDKLWQTNFNEFLDDFVNYEEGQDKTFLIVYCVLLSLNLLDDFGFLFLNTYFNNDSIREV